MFRHKRFNLTTGVILALVLTIAFAPVVVAQTPTPQPPPPDPPAEGTRTTPAPPSGGSGPPLPPGTTPTPVPPGTTPTPPAPPGNGGNGGNGNGGSSGGMMAPAWPPSNLIVHHAATQVQLAPVNDGLQTYLIGADGTGHSGPYIDSFSNLAQAHAGVATLWTGTNPGTGKSVTIYYLPAENKLRISTYYPDTQYDVNKPYVFTVDAGHNVVHDQW